MEKASDMVEMDGSRVMPWRDLPKSVGGGRSIDVGALVRRLGGELSQLPLTYRVVIENVARFVALGKADPGLLVAIVRRDNGLPTVPLRPTRLVLPDSSGIPALMDLAALREALWRDGLALSGARPVLPVDLVVDHSVTVDAARHAGALAHNMDCEFQRNGERYRFLKWAEQAFDGLKIVPPGMGIIHQVHLEYIADVVGREKLATIGEVAFPEFVLGGDSHTPMINALGVLGWGVGGVEIEAAMLGDPYLLNLPRTVGIAFTGDLHPGIMPTDIVLHVTERLRAVDCVGAFVEFAGPALSTLSVPDRATIANMAPEYGATTGFFPIDEQTLTFLAQTGRSTGQIELVECVARATGIFHDGHAPLPRVDTLVTIDLAEVEPSLAGPRRPHERQALSQVGRNFRMALTASQEAGGFGLNPATADCALPAAEGQVLRHGAVALAAITACTNTSNPTAMLAAGLLAQKAVKAGLSVPAFVKTSLAPGSRVVSRYLEHAGLDRALETLGFFTVGYGCTTCSGKSGPLFDEVSAAIDDHGLVAVAVLSGNRNFEGRVHRQVRANYIGSPPLVVAYALAGRIDIDFTTEPLGLSQDGGPVFLRELWPSEEELEAILPVSRDTKLYRDNYAHLRQGTLHWQSLDAPQGPRFPWSPGSSYIVEPPFFITPAPPAGNMLLGARALGLFGDSLTTDHIAPAGEIPATSEAGLYLAGIGITPSEFNAYTMRRGNHHVMMRGAFANVRIRNHMVPGSEGGITKVWPEGAEATIFAAAETYRARGTPLLVLGGENYGMGSSRDWAAKGPALLGVRAVIANSFERIHRANLISLGILPLLFEPGSGWRQLGLTGAERFDIRGIAAALDGAAPAEVIATRPDGRSIRFSTEVDIVALVEAQRLREGGIFSAVYAQARAAGEAMTEEMERAP